MQHGSDISRGEIQELFTAAKRFDAHTAAAQEAKREFSRLIGATDLAIELDGVQIPVEFVRTTDSGNVSGNYNIVAYPQDKSQAVAFVNLMLDVMEQAEPWGFARRVEEYREICEYDDLRLAFDIDAEDWILEKYEQLGIDPPARDHDSAVLLMFHRGSGDGSSLPLLQGLLEQGLLKRTQPGTNADN